MDDVIWFPKVAIRWRKILGQTYIDEVNTSVALTTLEWVGCIYYVTEHMQIPR